MMAMEAKKIPSRESDKYEKVSNSSLNSCSEGEICDSDFSPVREPIEDKYVARCLLDFPINVQKQMPSSYAGVSSRDTYPTRIPIPIPLAYKTIDNRYGSRSPQLASNYSVSPYARSISKSPNKKRRLTRRSRSPPKRRRSPSTTRDSSRRYRSPSRSRKRRHKHKRSKERFRNRSRPRSRSPHRHHNGSRSRKSRSSSRTKMSPKKIRYFDHDARKPSKSPIPHVSPNTKINTNTESQLSSADTISQSKDFNCALNRAIDSRLKQIPHFACQMSGDTTADNVTIMSEAELNKKMESFIKHLSKDQRPSPGPYFINLADDSPERKLPEVCKSRTDTNTKKRIVSRSFDSFQLLNKVGNGTYGDVYKAVEKTTGELKALKIVHCMCSEDGFPLTSIREIKLLRQLRHKNIVHLKEIVQDDNSTRTCLVFEYMEHDLKGLLRSGLVEFNESHIAYIIKQILEALNHCHMNCIIHRDVKCANVLVNNRCDVKLADFGMARVFNFDPKQRAYTENVVSLWYRPPEILLSSSDYSSAVDIWSAGCILGELFKKVPVFEVSSESELLEKIAFLCGTLIASVWPGMVNLPGYATYKPAVFHRRKLKSEFSYFPAKALELLDSMLQLDPEKRCSASQALKCEWLSCFDMKSIQMPRLPVTSDCHELKERVTSKNDVDQKLPSDQANVQVSDNLVPSELTLQNDTIDVNINHKISELMKLLQMADDSNIDEFARVIEAKTKYLDEVTSRTLINALKSHLEKRKKESKTDVSQQASIENSATPNKSIFANISLQSSSYNNADQCDLSNRPSLFETFNNSVDDFDTNEHSSVLELHTESNDITAYTAYPVLNEDEVNEMIQRRLSS